MRVPDSLCIAPVRDVSLDDFAGERFGPGTHAVSERSREKRGSTELVRLSFRRGYRIT